MPFCSVFVCGEGGLITPPMSHLCCHDETRSGRVDGDITGHQSHVLELFVHLSVLLVGESFDGTGKDHSLLLSEGQCNGISAREGLNSDSG